MICAAQGPTIEWQSVSSGEPCQVCGARRGCRFQAHGNFVCCVNCESDWPLTNGAWLHRVETELILRPEVPGAREP
jgi:hypothetical protein